MNWFNILVSLGALQGILLFIAVNSLKKGNKKANNILSLYILIIVLTLLGRYFYNSTNVTLFYLKVIFAGDLIIFLFGPMLYFYLLALFEIKPDLKIKNWIHFLPVAVFIIIISPLIISDRETFNLLIQHYVYIFYVIEFAAIVQNLFYLALNWLLLKKYLFEISQENSAVPQINFYKILLYITASGLAFWIFSFILRFVSPSLIEDFFGYQMVWVSLSCSVIALGYYTLSNPEVFQKQQNQKKYESKPAGIENIEELSLKLESLMIEEKPFLQPKLTISDLSKISGISLHLLSRIINEKFNKNFFEFVNNYRIEEFKSQLNNPENKNLTFLAIAFQVGFNSKTTFNTAFKKIENKTPREYFYLNSIDK